VVGGSGVKGERSESNGHEVPLTPVPETTPLDQPGEAETQPRREGSLIMLDVEVVAPLLRAKEVAALLAVSVWHLDQLRRDGLIKSVHVGSRTHRYHPDDVADFVRRRRG
jgi:hypothetical protein